MQSCWDVCHLKRQFPGGQPVCIKLFPNTCRGSDTLFLWTVCRGHQQASLLSRVCCSIPVFATSRVLVSRCCAVCCSFIGSLVAASKSRICQWPSGLNGLGWCNRASGSCRWREGASQCDKRSSCVEKGHAWFRLRRSIGTTGFRLGCSRRHESTRNKYRALHAGWEGLEPPRQRLARQLEVSCCRATVLQGVPSWFWIHSPTLWSEKPRQCIGLSWFPSAATARNAINQSQYKIRVYNMYRCICTHNSTHGVRRHV